MCRSFLWVFWVNCMLHQLFYTFTHLWVTWSTEYSHVSVLLIFSSQVVAFCQIRTISQLVPGGATSPRAPLAPSSLHRAQGGRRATRGFNHSNTCSVWSPATYLSSDLRQTGQHRWSNNIWPVELHTPVFHKLVICEKILPAHLLLFMFHMYSVFYQAVRWTAVLNKQRLMV